MRGKTQDGLIGSTVKRKGRAVLEVYIQNSHTACRRKYPISSGPLLHAIYPGVFDQTGCCRISNEGQFGLCLGILGKRGPNRSWIEEVSNKKKIGF